MKNRLLRYYGVSLGFILIILVFIMIGCDTTYTKPFEYPIQCKPVEIKYCEGFNTGSMKCRCINTDFETIGSNFRMA
tara:strand:+ start:1349 stop:1579 length:231 start_codon:yes stop_codon:yes gene_type:complete